MSDALPPGTVVGGRFEIKSELGQGAFATTYLAADAQEQSEVAVKAVSVTQLKDWKAFELFEREVEVLQSLNHVRIPRFVGYFSAPDQQTHFLVQEYARGESLKAKLDSGWVPSASQITQIATQLLEVLDYLIRLNPPVVHRDLKPANIIIDENLRVKLVDFGAAKDKAASHTALGSTVVGTYGYMAPEQFQGQASPASDLYALGATLVHLLTGVAPSDLPHKRMKLDFSSHVSADNPLAALIDKMVEPAVEDRLGPPALLLEYFKNPQAWFDAQKPRFPVQPTGSAGAMVKPAGARLRVDVASDGTFVLSEEKKLSGRDRRRLFFNVVGLGMGLFWSAILLRVPSPVSISFALLVTGVSSVSLWSSVRRITTRRRLRVGPETFVISRVRGKKETVIHSGATNQLQGIDYYLYEPRFYENRRERRFDLGVKEGLHRHTLLENADVLEAQWAAQEMEHHLGIKSQTEHFEKPSLGAKLGRAADALVNHLIDRVNNKWFKP